MSQVQRLVTLMEVEEEAAAWAWRLDAETVTIVDRQAFEAWLRRDARHRRAFAEFERLWRELDHLSAAKRFEKLATFTAPAARATFGGLAVWAASLAAMLLLSLAVTRWFTPGNTSASDATAVGQHRMVTLPDQSVVTLNTNTIVETRFERGLRQVFLLKGEAHFAVAHDRSRPFLVHAGDAVVRAVGTEFDVRIRDANHIEVLVNEGIVEVQTAAPSRAVEAGERLSAGPRNVVVQNVSRQEVARAMAWRQGAVVFEGQPLSEAIAELSRYTDTRFVITDPRITALPVGGRFRTEDVPGFLTALEKAFPVFIRRAPDGLVYIEPQS